MIIKNLKSFSIIGYVSSFKGYLLLLIIAIFLFVSGMFYGVIEYKSGLLSNYYKQFKGVMATNLDIIPNSLMGLKVNHEPLYIDIKAENLQKLSYLRSEALKNDGGTILEKIKDESVKGVIRYKNTKYKVKISLTGQNFDHIALAYKWSFRVKITDGKTLNGINKFTLLVPGTRGSNLLSEWIGHKLSKYLGLVTLRYNHKKIIVNGKDYGVYAFEEHFDKRMIENNKLREGLIVKADLNSLQVYKMKEVVNNPNLKIQFDNLELAWLAFISGKIKTHKIFDIEKLAKYYALSDVLNGQHTHYMGNEFYYFNPITGLLEPIGREWDAPNKDSDFKIFIEDYTLGDSDQKTVTYQKLIFSDAKFTMRYLDELKRIANRKFINNFLNEIKDDTDLERSIIYSEYPHMNAKTDFIFNQIDRINQNIDQDYSHLISSQVINIYPEKLVIEVNNQSRNPIYVDSISVEGKDYSVAKYVSRESKENIEINKENAHENSMLIKYRFGGKLDFFSKKILKSTDNEISNKYKSNVSYEIPQINENYVLGKLKKKWIFDGNIVIHAKSRLIILPGVTVDLIKGSSITVLGGGVELNGEKDNNINIISSDGSGQGLIVLNSHNKSYVNHTNFNGLSVNNLNGSNRAQTSPVVFYESDVEITNSTFINNTSEDALNIIRSSFVLNKVLFKDNPSDAFDSDFSHGEIINSNFINIGNDAIDVSGSEININSVFINSSLDKAISIGERSNIIGNYVTIQKSGIAIAAKDSSTFIFNNLELSHNNVAFALFNKKSEFSGASGTANNATLFNNKVKYLIEKDSEMHINDSFIRGEITNVKKLIYEEK